MSNPVTLPAPPDFRGWTTLRDVAQRAGVSRQAVHAAMKAGTLRSLETPLGRLVVEEDAAAYVARWQRRRAAFEAAKVAIAALREVGGVRDRRPRHPA